MVNLKVCKAGSLTVHNSVDKLEKIFRLEICQIINKTYLSVDTLQLTLIDIFAFSLLHTSVYTGYWMQFITYNVNIFN